MMKSINWDETGTLRQVSCGYDIRTDPLWILVTTAMQGHEGSVEDMEIIMESGSHYGPNQIRTLAIQPDRKAFLKLNERA
ncbi:hypothetical protein B0E47_02835 [Rhodanobacter sp. B05]|nr:hypothetical protein B0E47_02835 [Rhodanobacter sp. B05]